MRRLTRRSTRTPAGGASPAPQSPVTLLVRFPGPSNASESPHCLFRRVLLRFRAGAIESRLRHRLRKGLGVRLLHPSQLVVDMPRGATSWCTGSFLAGKFHIRGCRRGHVRHRERER